jgi:replication-associated recombination protein RarA
MAYELRTKKGYDFYEAASALQKACRRGDIKIAAFFAIELYSSGYWNYVWKRLLTISAEDCHGLITQEVKALHDSFLLVNERDLKKCSKGRIFIAKAVIILCQAKHSRDADHLTNLYYDGKRYDEAELQDYIDHLEADDYVEEIPSYTYDIHTRKGKQMGKTKAQFFMEEDGALKNKQIGFFDNYLSISAFQNAHQ